VIPSAIGRLPGIFYVDELFIRELEWKGNLL